MNEELTAATTAALEPSLTPEAAPEPALSIAEHAAQFDPKRDRSSDASEEPQAPLAANATPEQKAAHHSEQQRREKETGKFTEGRKRHRAASQQATAADVPRIQELTRRNRELQAQIDAARQAAPVAAQATIAPAQAQRQAPPQNAPQHQPQVAAPAVQRVSDPSDPEPKETDAKYAASANGPLEYFQDWSRWNVRDEHRQERARQEHHAAIERRSVSWGERVEAAMKDQADYAQIAFQPVPWLAESTIDKFIDQDDNGAKILYHLNSNPQDRDALMRMTDFQQGKFLALLSQRLDSAASPQTVAAGTTGSAPRSNVRHLVPRPPNPVRTEPQGATSGPPTDGSLSIAAHKKAFAPQRR